MVYCNTDYCYDYIARDMADLVDTGVGRAGAPGYVQELCVGGGGGAGDHDLLLVTTVTGNLATPLKPAVAG